MHGLLFNHLCLLLFDLMKALRFLKRVLSAFILLKRQFDTTQTDILKSSCHCWLDELINKILISYTKKNQNLEHIFAFKYFEIAKYNNCLNFLLLYYYYYFFYMYNKKRNTLVSLKSHPVKVICCVSQGIQKFFSAGKL